ncbi:diphthine--ammonia ligase [Candidatus Micrarchaeota archaeon]|nr:diphthine--ammonia ligase [Candidatus Micrarchaeota archaeon]
MCGIFGQFNNEYSIEKNLLSHRGKDDFKQIDLPKGKLMHFLHSMVGNTPQPLKKQGILVANCEIYNWKKINKKFGFNTNNDAETLLELLDLKFKEKNFIEKVKKELDGEFAFAYYINGKVFLVRDTLGTKPLWYICKKGIVFASEGKVLYGYGKPIELHPRHIIEYDVEKDRIVDHHTEWNPLGKEKDLTDEELFESIKQTVAKRTEGFDKVAILFSGGMDSTIIAIALKELGKKVYGYVGGVENSKDILKANEIGDKLGINIKTHMINEDKSEDLIEKVVYICESCDPMKIGVGIPIYTACFSASKDKHKMILTGAGGDDLFAGYEKHLKTNQYGHNINRELLSSLRSIYERDLYRDDVVAMANAIETRVPYLDISLIDKVLNSPGERKIQMGKKSMIKKLLNYLKNEKVIENEVNPERIAAQYGSGINKLIDKIRKKKKYTTRTNYLMGIQNKNKHSNSKLGVLFSGGKDSFLALRMMKKRGYIPSCLITIQSQNKDSFMFHTPKISEVPNLSKKLGIPLILEKTKGEKEKELIELESAICKAKKRYGIEGVVSGAVASTYQRNRIEDICEHIGLKMYSPLWYLDQEEEMKLLFHEGIRFKIVHSDLSDLKPWVDKEIIKEDIEKFKKFKININGEGGEYETLVVKTPDFI